MTGLQLAPVILSLLVLGAHFLRSGNLLLVALCLALALLTAGRRPWMRRVLQGALVLGAAEWARTLVSDVASRRAEGGDWRRLAVILGSVAAFTALSAMLLESPRLRRRFVPGTTPES